MTPTLRRLVTVENVPESTRPALGAAGETAAFFDVDNTIIRGASAFHIARGLRRRGFFTTLDIVRFGWHQARYLLFGENKNEIDKVRSRALSIVEGRSVAEIAVVGEEIYDEVLSLRIFPGTRALLDDGQRAGADLVDLVLVLAEQQVPHLVPAEAHDVERGEEATAAKAAGDVERAGTADDRVVHVEERRRLTGSAQGRPDRLGHVLHCNEPA